MSRSKASASHELRYAFGNVTAARRPRRSQLTHDGVLQRKNDSIVCIA